MELREDELSAKVADFVAAVIGRLDRQARKSALMAR
jgi:hypothetical protein